MKKNQERRLHRKNAKIAKEGSWFVFPDEIESGLSVFGFEDEPFLSYEAPCNESASQRIAVDEDERFHFVGPAAGSRIQKVLPPSFRDS